MVRKKLRIVLICVAIALGIVGYVYYNYNVKDSIEIRKNMLVGDAIADSVKAFDYRGSHSWIISYHYTVNGQNIAGERRCDKRKYKQEDLLGRHFPVVYSSINNNINDILVNRRDSIEYGLIQ